MNKGKANPDAPAATPGTAANRLLEPAQRSRTRPAAITRNLYTWSNYKNWAEKVRSNWDDKNK
ncbi:MAG: hypothetical protein QM718_12625 [Steroidobacteraceae bacterium]